MMRAGADRRVITPSIERPVWLAGFQPNRPALGIQDNLYVRTLALQDGLGELLVLSACDLIGVLRGEVLAIRAAAGRQGIDERAVHVIATHTHHGPDTIGLWGPDPATTGRDPHYIDALCASAVDSICAAVGRLAPACIRSASAIVGGLARNARDPGILDEELSVLAAEDRAGRPIAALLCYPCHPEVLWRDNQWITPDYAGALCRALDETRGGVNLFVPGALGGMMTPAVEEHSFSSCEAMGRALAAAADEMLTASLPVEDAAISLARRELAVPLENPLFRLAGAAGLLPFHALGGSVTTEIGYARVGATTIAFLPGEPLPALGLGLKKRMPGDVRIVAGLSNDELGYILPEAEFSYPENPLEPGDHYEETMSLGPRTAPVLLGALDELMRESGDVSR